MQTLVTIRSAILSALMFATVGASVELPKFVVPNHSDLVVKTRYSFGEQMIQVSTLYLKGARERTEHVMEKPAQANGMSNAQIRQCDKKQSIFLNERDKIYFASEIQDWSERVAKGSGTFTPRMSGAEVTMTIDSVDTGERRPYQHYTARHVKTETRVEPGSGAVTPASMEQTDGWYIDIPEFGCEDRGTTGVSWVAASSGPQDRLEIKWLGKAPRGYAIEESSVKTTSGVKTFSKVELLELSEASLDPSLFELPAGYRPALQTGNGGADLTKPDTVSNRAEYYWKKFRRWAGSIGS
jgi:hypothetical protein